jgi:pimeloyl-ACP methyl ester carboxylesterase
MKTIQKIYILLACLIALNAHTQNTRIDWIHGLGGNQTSWNQTANQYEAQRQIGSFTNNWYNTGLGVESMAHLLAPATAQSFANNNSIAIGHSMGGVAARQLNLWNNDRWGGIITLTNKRSCRSVASKYRTVRHYIVKQNSF